MTLHSALTYVLAGSRPDVEIIESSGRESLPEMPNESIFPAPWLQKRTTLTKARE
jgi:hypothetical protein